MSPVTLDPKVLIAVEDGAPRATAAIKILLRLGYTLQITPIVLAALGRMAQSSDNGIEQAIAYNALQDGRASAYHIDKFTSAEKTVVREHAKRLMEKNAIPGGTMADAKLVVEASYRDGKAALLTRRHTILDANRGLLDIALGDCGLGGAGNLKIFSPELLIQYDAGVMNRSEA